MRIAVVQFSPRRGDLVGNVDRIEQILGGVEADLCVLPELCSTGYLFTRREELLPLAEPPGDGRLGAMLWEYVESSGTAVIAGYAEKSSDGKLFNSALAMTEDGALVNYRKAHLFYREREVFQPGNTPFPVFDLKGTGIGIMICYDWRFPEVARTLRLRGAQVIAHPSNLVASRKLWVPTNSVRALENRVFIATANRGGKEASDGEELTFSGGSAVFDVNGSIIASLDNDDGVIVVDIDPDRALQTSFNGINDILLDRRPDLYDL
jgi:predicted amidohydrolase